MSNTNENIRFRELMGKDFDAIFHDLDLFIEALPRMAKVIGQEEFSRQMGFGSHMVLYRRIKSPGQWKVEELHKAKEVLKAFFQPKN